MTSEKRPVDRLRPTPLLMAAAVMQLSAIVLYAVNASEQRISPLWGWVPGVVLTGLTALACRNAAVTTGMDPVAARLWRTISLATVLIALGTVGDARMSVVEPARVTQQQHDVASSVCYALAIGLILWGMLRLPMRHTGHLRFALDTLTLTATVGVFAWYFTMRAVDSGDARRTTLPTLTLAVLGLIVALALVKVAMSGMGGLERGTLRWFATAAGVGTLGGGLFPLVFDLHPGLSGSQIFIPATMICVALAADRQRRAAGIEPREPRRRMTTLLPYAAVAATDALLLHVCGRLGRTVFVVASAAAFLTALVVIRQIAALRENKRLLAQVDDKQAELTHRATHDALTGLANRTLFEQSAAAGVGGTVSLALIDLDDFKGVNDRLGHAVGDGLLVAVADRLRECVRDRDVVARLGGDEFGLVLTGMTGDAAVEVLVRVCEAMHRPVQVAGHDLLVRASIGLAEAWPGVTPQELLRRADVAMYAAKARGKGRYALYDAVLDQHHQDDARLGADLRRALDAGEFTLVYQPIVRLPEGDWTGLETLVRWTHPSRGVVPPDQFIAIAERTGLIVPLGDWILRTALCQFAAWGADLKLGVNVSARQLREPGFVARVRAALAESGVRPEQLVIEVTETAVFDGGVAVDALNDLARMGVRVALDDFGTGHSSLGLLRTAPAETLKVDKSFVDGIGGSSEEAVIATAMIQITDGLHLQAVAEGVETADQANTLHRLGYRFAQGYHFARPLPPGEIGSRLTSGALARSAG